MLACAAAHERQNQECQCMTHGDVKMENEKVEPSPNQRAIFEDKTQQDNKTLQDKTQLSNEDITKRYKTGYNQHASPQRNPPSIWVF